MKIKLLLQLGAAGGAAAWATVFAQGTFTVTFDGPPIQPPATSYVIDSYAERGMLFTPINETNVLERFARNGSGIQAYPDNGSAYLQASGSSTLKFAFTNGAPFDLITVDLAGYSWQIPNGTVHFIGYRPDGQAVSAQFSVSTIQFQTFTFGTDFLGLERVELPRFQAWSLDNLVIGVPEPGGIALVTLAGTSLLFRRQRNLPSGPHRLSLHRRECAPSDHGRGSTVERPDEQGS